MILSSVNIFNKPQSLSPLAKIFNLVLTTFWNPYKHILTVSIWKGTWSISSKNWGRQGQKHKQKLRTLLSIYNYRILIRQVKGNGRHQEVAKKLLYIILQRRTLWSGKICGTLVQIFIVKVWLRYKNWSDTYLCHLTFFDLTKFWAEI